MEQTLFFKSEKLKTEKNTGSTYGKTTSVKNCDKKNFGLGPKGSETV